MLIRLGEEAEKLLIALMEAHQRAEERGPFAGGSEHGRLEISLTHFGGPERDIPAYPEDLRELESLGLIRRWPQSTERDWIFDLTSGALDAYEQLKASEDDRLGMVEDEVERHLRGHDFRRHHPDAFEQWCEAERLLWVPDSADRGRDVGFACREATQAFGRSLLAKAGAAELSDPTRTKEAVEVALRQRSDRSETLTSLLISLHAYWCNLIEVVQRQVHSEDLSWEDSRATVFNLAFVMSELNRHV